MMIYRSAIFRSHYGIKNPTFESTNMECQCLVSSACSTNPRPSPRHLGATMPIFIYLKDWPYLLAHGVYKIQKACQFSNMPVILSSGFCFLLCFIIF